MRFRKGELNFYRSMTPIELSKYKKSHAEDKEYIDKFLKEYYYVGEKKNWRKGTRPVSKKRRF